MVISNLILLLYLFCKTIKLPKYVKINDYNYRNMIINSNFIFLPLLKHIATTITKYFKFVFIFKKNYQYLVIYCYFVFN